MELKLNAILKEEAKSQVVEIKRPTFYGKGGSRTSDETELYIGKTRVVIRQGIVQSEIPAEGPISKEIAYLIVGVRAETDMFECILNVKREKGKYVHPENKETTGTVEFYMNGINKIGCYGPDREKTLALLELIRAGKIRPEVSYDVPQDGKSRQELERDLSITHHELEVSTGIVKGFKEQLDQLQSARDKNNDLRFLARVFHTHPFWSPLIFKRNAALRIEDILDRQKK